MAKDPTFTRTEDGLWVDEEGEIYDFPEAEGDQLAWFIHQFHGASESEKGWKAHKGRMGLGIKELSEEKYATAGDIRASIITSSYTTLDKDAVWDAICTEVLWFAHESGCDSEQGCECRMAPVMTLVADLVNAAKTYDKKKLGPDLLAIFESAESKLMRKPYVKTIKARTEVPDYSVGKGEDDGD